MGRLKKARWRGSARKIAKFGRKVQKYSKLAAAASRQLGGLFDAAADSDSDDDEDANFEARSTWVGRDGRRRNLVSTF